MYYNYMVMLQYVSLAIAVYEIIYCCDTRQKLWFSKSCDLSVIIGMLNMIFTFYFWIEK